MTDVAVRRDPRKDVRRCTPTRDLALVLAPGRARWPGASSLRWRALVAARGRCRCDETARLVERPGAAASDALRAARGRRAGGASRRPPRHRAARRGRRARRPTSRRPAAADAVAGPTLIAVPEPGGGRRRRRRRRRRPSWAGGSARSGSWPTPGALGRGDRPGDRAADRPGRADPGPPPAARRAAAPGGRTAMTDPDPTAAALPGADPVGRPERPGRRRRSGSRSAAGCSAGATAGRCSGAAAMRRQGLLRRPDRPDRGQLSSCRRVAAAPVGPARPGAAGRAVLPGARRRGGRRRRWRSRWAWPTAGWSGRGSTPSARSGSPPWPWASSPCPAPASWKDFDDPDARPERADRHDADPAHDPLDLRGDHRRSGRSATSSSLGRSAGSTSSTPDSPRFDGARPAAGLGDHPGQGRGGDPGRLPGLGLRADVPEPGDPRRRRPEHRPDRRDRPRVRRAPTRGSACSRSTTCPPAGPARPTPCRSPPTRRGATGSGSSTPTPGTSPRTSRS